MSLNSTASSQQSRDTLFAAKWHVPLLIVMIAASLLPIWISEHFPSQNGPWYLLAAHMMGQFDNPQWNFDEFYQLSGHPIPHMLHTLLMFGFGKVFPILIAQKLALSLYVIGVPLSIFYFLSVAAPQKKFLGYFAFLMIHNYTFFRGYHNFSLCIPLFFFAFGYWLRHRDNFTVWRVATMVPLVTALYLAHLFGFLLLGCSIGWYRLMETSSLKKAIHSGLAATWVGWLMLVDFVVLNATTNSWVDHEELEFLMPHEAVEYFVRKFFFSMSLPAYYLGSAMLLWVIYLVGKRLFQSPEEGGSRLRAALRNPMITLTAILFVAYFFVPYKVMNWHYANVRLLPFILGLSLACAGRLPQWGRGLGFQTAFLGTVCFAAVGVDVLLAQQVVQAEQIIQQYISGTEAFEQNSRLLPINVENAAVGQIRPLTRAHEYYHIAKGGANGKGAAKYNTLVPVWYRTYPVEKMFPNWSPKAPDESMQKIVKVYDFVLIWGEDDDLLRRFEQARFQIVHHNGKLRLLRNENSIARRADELTKVQFTAIDQNVPDSQPPLVGR